MTGFPVSFWGPQIAAGCMTPPWGDGSGLPDGNWEAGASRRGSARLQTAGVPLLIPGFLCRIRGTLTRLGAIIGRSNLFDVISQDSRTWSIRPHAVDAAAVQIGRAHV